MSEAFTKATEQVSLDTVPDATYHLYISNQCQDTKARKYINRNQSDMTAAAAQSMSGHQSHEVHQS